MDNNHNLLNRYSRLAVLCLGTAIMLFILYWLFREGGRLLSVLAPFFVAIIIAYILNPLVDFLDNRRLPRYLGILLIYAIFFSLLLVVGLTTIPNLVTELNKLADRIPEYTLQFQQFLANLQSDYQRFNLPESIRQVLDQNILNLQAGVQAVVARLTEAVLGIFSHLFTILIIPLLVYYLLRDETSLKRSALLLFPKKYRRWIAKVGSEMDHTLGAYFRGMLLICFLVGLLTYVGLLLLGVDFALILGMIAGVTNIIPYFGPLIGAVPAVLIAVLHSPALALKVIIVITVVQQLESQLIAPQILGRSLGLHPLIVIFALIVGGRLFGLFGLIFAVPFTAMLRILFKHVVDLAANK
ncbi:MAG: AI-2E family transporter [Dethiobacter sp.]|nr:AI-2E family transporter [Dethiobacter sp.]